MSRYFIEGATYSREQLAGACIDDDRLGEHDFNTVLGMLCHLVVGKKQMLRKASNGGYVFQYVGIIALGDYLYAILPKYYTDDDGTRTLTDEACEGAAVFPHIMGAIGKYNSNASKRRSAARDQDKVTLQLPFADTGVVQGRIELYRYILQDFASNGLYDNAKRIREYNGEGDIEWNRTINQIMPVMSRRRPVYMNLMTERRIRETSNIVARIQEAILVEISGIVKSLHLNDVLHFPLYERPVRTLDDLGGVEYAKRCLEKELTVQFETRRKLLLQSLLAYLYGRSVALLHKVLVEGTGSYNLVWEDICRVVFNDCDYVDKAHPRWDYRTGFLWDEGNGNSANEESAELASENDGIDELGNEAGPLIPDVVTRIGKTNEWHIVDAKYYKPKWNVSSVSGVPGVGDIVKQYFYQMHLQQHEPDAEVRSNSFVMPAQIRVGDRVPHNGKLLRRRGQVSLECVRQHLKSIQVLEMDPRLATDMYLRNDRSRAGVLLRWVDEKTLAYSSKPLVSDEDAPAQTVEEQ